MAIQPHWSALYARACRPLMPDRGDLAPPGSREVATVQFAIRCLPRVPVDSEELEHWLEEKLAELRRQVPEGTIRLSRLTDALPSTEVSIGWLVEFDLPDDRSLLASGRLAPMLRDLRLLGFQPTLLAPHVQPRANGTWEDSG